MNLVSTKNRKIFLCLNGEIVTNEKIDIILSPEFYWVRIFDIPVKTVSQARQVLPTLFEDIIETVSELSYQVLKLEENKFICFAYVNKTIFEAIKNSGVNLSLVDSVYFAQNEFKDISEFVYEEKSFLYTNDGVLVKVPNNLINEKLDISTKLEELTLSSNKVDIKLYNNLLTTKQINMIIIACVILCSINIFKYFSYNNEINKLEEKIENIKSNSSMPSSSLQVNSIISSYQKSVDLEVRKREALEYILENKDFKVSNIELIKDSLIVDFESGDKNQIDKYIAKKYKIISSVVKNLSVNIEVKL